MTEPRFTKGPWKYSPTNSSVTYTMAPADDGTPRGRLAASVYHGELPNFPMIRVGAANEDAEEVKANATLVAAAPELFEALQAFVSAENDTENPAIGIHAYDAAMEKAYELAKSALSKALGGDNA